MPQTKVRPAQLGQIPEDILEINKALANTPLAIKTKINVQRFLFKSSKPNSVHKIVHGLATEYPVVTCWVLTEDGSYFLVDPSVTKAVNANLLELTFPEPRSIKVIVQAADVL
jgi:hypothetical protein